MEWRNKLYHYEEEPPEHVWDRVSGELEQDAPAYIRESLYELRETPPADAWENISGALGKEKTGKVRRIPGSWKVASAIAAAVLAFLPFLIWRESLAPKVSVSMIRPSRPEPSPSPVPQNATSALTPDNEVREPSMSIEPLIQESLSDNTHSSGSIGMVFQKDRNYIYFTSRSGEQRRISYKLEKLLPAIRSHVRNDTVARWMSTLEHSSFIPSGNNFFDILEMVKLAEQNQR